MEKPSKSVLNKNSIRKLSSYIQAIKKESFSDELLEFPPAQSKTALSIMRKTFSTVLEKLKEKETLRENDLLSIWKEALTKSWEDSAGHPSQTDTPIPLEQLQEVIADGALKVIFKVVADGQKGASAHRAQS